MIIYFALAADFHPEGGKQEPRQGNKMQEGGVRCEPDIFTQAQCGTGTRCLQQQEAPSAQGSEGLG